MDFDYGRGIRLLRLSGHVQSPGEPHAAILIAQNLVLQ
jgi:hypothetical protein